MKEHTIYFAKNDFYNIIRTVGGTWNDSKERPLICLIKLLESDDIYWAIPMGNFNHRSDEAKQRIQKFISYDKKDIRSCFYHIGNTDVTSIFFITDVVPITQKYIERSYIGKYTQQPFVIKNKKLLAELKRKLTRILYWENTKPNYYRQHITGIKKYLLAELEEENKQKENNNDIDSEE